MKRIESLLRDILADSSPHDRRHKAHRAREVADFIEFSPFASSGDRATDIFTAETHRLAAEWLRHVGDVLDGSA